MCCGARLIRDQQQDHDRPDREKAHRSPVNSLVPASSRRMMGALSVGQMSWRSSRLAGAAERPSIDPGCWRDAYPMPPMASPHSIRHWATPGISWLCGTLALDGVRIAVDDPFLWSACDPGVAEAAKDAVDAFVPRHGIVQNDVTRDTRSLRVVLDGGVSTIELLSRELPDRLEQLGLWWRQRCAVRRPRARENNSWRCSAD
jgi:hypothetical protein